MPRLDELLDESIATAQPDLKSIFDTGERRMSAAELRAFFQSVRLWAMATTGANGSPHIAPVHVRLTDDDQLEMTIHVESVRMRDIERDPHVAFNSWGEGGKTAIIYGIASVIPGSERESGAGGRAKPVVRLRIEPTRIYAMDPRRGT